MRVDHAATESLEHRGPHQAHEPGEHNQRRVESTDGARELCIPGSAVGMVPQADNGRGHTSAARMVQSGGVDVGDSGDDLERRVRLGVGAQQGREGRAASGQEDNDTSGGGGVHVARLVQGSGRLFTRVGPASPSGRCVGSPLRCSVRSRSPAGTGHNGGVSDEQNTQDTSPRPNGPENTRQHRSRRTLAALTVMLLVSWMLMLSPLPLSLLSGVTGLIAALLLVLVVVQTVRDGRRSSAVITAAFGLPAVAMIVLGAAASAVFYGPLKDVQDCQRVAITERARTECAQVAEDSSVAWFSSLFGS